MKAKEKILEIINGNGKSTSRIAGLVGIDFNYALKLLEELEKEKKVKRIVVGEKTIYWKKK